MNNLRQNWFTTNVVNWLGEFLSERFGFNIQITKEGEYHRVSIIGDVAKKILVKIDGPTFARKDSNLPVAKWAARAEGWNPATSDYWDEMDNRLRRYLPHRYNDVHEESSSRRKPRSPVTSSGRENASSAGGRQSFELTTEQVRAMKDAGFWDDPKKRLSMIKRYAEQAAQQRTSRG